MKPKFDSRKKSSAVPPIAKPPGVCHIGKLPPAVLYRIAEFATHIETTREDYDNATGQCYNILNPRKCKTATLFSRHPSVALSQTNQLFRKVCHDCFFEERVFTFRTFQINLNDGLFEEGEEKRPTFKTRKSKHSETIVARVFLREKSGIQVVQVPRPLWLKIQKLHVRTSSIPTNQLNSKEDLQKHYMSGEPPLDGATFNVKLLLESGKVLFPLVKQLELRYEGLCSGTVWDPARFSSDNPPRSSQGSHQWLMKRVNTSWVAREFGSTYYRDDLHFGFDADKAMIEHAFPALQTIGLEREMNYVHASIRPTFEKLQERMEISSSLATRRNLRNFLAMANRWYLTLNVVDAQFLAVIRDSIAKKIVLESGESMNAESEPANEEERALYFLRDLSMDG